MALLGCAANGDDGSYPTRPGNGGGVGTGGADARTDATPGDGGVATTGRVCLTTDLRKPDQCASVGADGMVIRRGTATATTRADGTFDLPTELVTGDWQVTKLGFVPSVLPFVAGAPVFIPVISTANFNNLLAGNSIVIVDGQGTLVVTARRPTGLPKPLVVVSTDPTSVPGVYYDGASALVWDRDATGTQGVALVPGLIAGTVNVAGIAPDGTRTAPQVPITAGAITFLQLDFLQ